MARYARGKYSYGIDDRTGRKVRLRDLKREWGGVLVHKSEWEEKHPQLTPPKNINDPQVLRNPRPDIDPVNALIQYGTYGKRGISTTMALNAIWLPVTLLEAGNDYLFTEAGIIMLAENGTDHLQEEEVGVSGAMSIGTATVVIT
jgi:hypothetical protein